MPAGPIGPCWIENSWSDTCWEENTWGEGATGTGTQGETGTGTFETGTGSGETGTGTDSETIPPILDAVLRFRKLSGRLRF